MNNRAHILWADNDAIVNGERYRKDSQWNNFPPGTNHISVCKLHYKVGISLCVAISSLVSFGLH